MKYGWDERFMALAEHVAGWSKDPSTCVGAVIVDELGRVVGMGYNGFPRGVHDDEYRYSDRSLKYPRVVHAELNAILNSVKEPRGCVIYCTLAPCSVCAGPIIQAGITDIYVNVNPADERWKESQEVAFEMFEEAGVTFHNMFINPVAKDEEIPF